MDELPPEVRQVATLRGLGLSAGRIGKISKLPRCRVEKLLALYRRPFKSPLSVMGERKLSSRAVNSLGLCGIHTPDDALARGLEGVMHALWNIPNCGTSTRDEVKRWMQYYAGQAAEAFAVTHSPQANSDNGSKSACPESEGSGELVSPVCALSPADTHLSAGAA